jgi:hypothetical protein
MAMENDGETTIRRQENGDTREVMAHDRVPQLGSTPQALEGGRIASCQSL